MLRISLSFLSILLLSLPVVAAQLDELRNVLPKGVQISYIVAPTTVNASQAQNTKQQKNSQVLMLPASTQKLLTALTAKLYLTNDFTFKTKINGVVDNNVPDKKQLSNTTFIFNADPTFSRRDLRAMLLQLKLQGVTHINGDIRLDLSRFNGYNWSSGQVWNDQAVCYAAQVSALIINGNCVLGNLKRTASKHIQKTNSQDNIAAVFIPNYQPLVVTSTVKIVNENQQQAQFCDLEVTRKANNNYELFGCITRSKKPLPLSFAISEPIVYFSTILRQELNQLNISFRGDITTQQHTSKQATLVTHQSPSLDTLIHTMLKESDNLIADVLFKTIGAEYYQQPGNYRNSASAMQAILQSKGIDISQAYIADGSGLSRHNLLSAQMLFDTLNYIIKHDKQLKLIDAMPISGKDGTLKYRRGLLSKALKDKVQAKTGSLKGASNMVGIVTAKDNQKVPFVLMINGYNPAKNKLRNEPSALIQYQSKFFTVIVNQR